MTVRDFFGSQMGRELLVDLGPIYSMTTRLLSSNLQYEPIRLRSTRSIDILTTAAFRFVRGPIREIRVSRSNCLMVSVLLIARDSTLAKSV